ncbi:MAG: NADH:ubiquinone reductase (Na(+)-transporting) subunit C [Candidatus Marinimicrobia bacterium]|jgi:Na+-transporting NADH:ubiquinone oxidoreductase subunit C|nr:NADH:ubiquinone reductase (Na(+)-transporting) subunit C [Candidatus Neomarinimicrobiota bacterium]MBT3501850.1 NADH:ubiquinone reductase (Na(+)-transporting) subunit C [Candidatus Neomarinimicrobiota bacterium]MBT3838624.1 NADH:ubiquinone reductase (Na(+)-transporting) subunit C [Candidatus Neomarinimicrobiota bacterium]MBT3999762.1 NADH:ubiquinone reductase (Na(+)-transporting) subunit C [Candidatus Neomarinimicrobiota bacterium]MBT4578631.1 NADH:ubiquinone reductase (Na(+)-transporting) s
MRSNTYTIVFTSIVTIVLGFLLAVAADALKERQELNVANDMKKNILLSLGFKPAADKIWSSEEIHSLFDKNINAIVLDAKGNKTDKDPKKIDTVKDIENLPIYIKKSGNKIGGYAIPIAGKGLWSTLYGYFAVEPDGRTVKGITFYKHGETPGLGAEVDKLWFQKNFIGKKFVDESDQLVGVKVVKGKVLSDDPKAIHKVDGISGATMTGKGLEVFLLDDLLKYEPFFKAIRGNS